MRITVLAVNDYQNDPRARVLIEQLTRAGHDVTLVRIGHQNGDLDRPFDEALVSPNQPPGTSLRDRLLRKLQTQISRNSRRDSALVRRTVESDPELIVPTTEAAVQVAAEAAAQTSAFVARAPQWNPAGPLDLIDMAPSTPSASRPIRTGLPFHTPESQSGAIPARPRAPRGDPDRSGLPQDRLQPRQVS